MNSYTDTICLLPKSFPMKTTRSSLKDSLNSVFAAVVIPLEIIIAFLTYFYVLGNPENFQGGDPANHPLPGNYLGIANKGGLIEPDVLGLILIVVPFLIENARVVTPAAGN